MIRSPEGLASNGKVKRSNEGTRLFVARLRSPGGGIQRVPISDCAVTDMALKQQALSRLAPDGTPPGRYTPPDSLLAFLDTL